MAPPNISDLLRHAAQSNHTTGVITYPSGVNVGLKTSYSQLLAQAEYNAQNITKINGFKPKSIILLHLDDHFDNIVLFWSIILAGGVPCVSTPFTNIPAQREKHIRHLHTLLENPICISRRHLLPQFSGQNLITPYTLEDLEDIQFPSRLAITLNSKGTSHVNGVTIEEIHLKSSQSPHKNGVVFEKPAQQPEPTRLVNGTATKHTPEHPQTAHVNGSQSGDLEPHPRNHLEINGFTAEVVSDSQSLPQVNESEQSHHINGTAHKELSLQPDTTTQINGFASATYSPSDFDDLALLMLTSGSTGNAKAVRLSHAQMISAVAGKSTVRKTPQGSPFLNWINFDHVACVTEIHLQAMYLGVNQVHVPASDIVSSPSLFLRLLSEHRVGKSFAPNFYLAKLKKFLESEEKESSDQNIDLSQLHWLSSGGEPNVVDMCEGLADLMTRYGARRDVIVPGFGMTETCAGSIWNTEFPQYDVANKHQFAALGKCMPGIEMRVVSDSEDVPTAVPADHPGLLEVRGPIVLKGYFNNPAATSESISPEGWFRTGDRALIDSAGNLNLIGRKNDHININGVKYLPSELETALEESSIPGVTPYYTVCFPFRSAGSQTEQICVVYLPAYSPDDTEARIIARKEIIKATMLQTGAQPRVLPLNSTFLEKSTLGKLSRPKIRASFERGEYKELEEIENTQILAYTNKHMAHPQNDTEKMILEMFGEVLEIPTEEIGVETPVYDIGVTSIHLIRMKMQLQQRLSIPDIPISVIMTNPTIRSLCQALETLNQPKEYNPIVVLQHGGDKTPIWLFHPGVGEILVFLGLSKYLQGRPVYALRARGFEPGETRFRSIGEAVETYHQAIKSKQQEGPYALAGYSYGAMLAFETSKALLKNGDNISFLGSFNLPPHIKDRMQQLEWSECLLHLCYFLDLISADDAVTLAPKFALYSRKKALEEIFKHIDQARMAELSLSPAMFENWVNISYGLQSMATTYEPSGIVPVMDIFVAEPLAIVAASREEWKAGKLSKWRDFCESEPRFHDVDGEHYTMINETHVLSFQKIFRKALEERGL